MQNYLALVTEKKNCNVLRNKMSADDNNIFDANPDWVNDLLIKPILSPRPTTTGSRRSRTGSRRSRTGSRRSKTGSNPIPASAGPNVNANPIPASTGPSPGLGNWINPSPSPSPGLGNWINPSPSPSPGLGNGMNPDVPSRPGSPFPAFDNYGENDLYYGDFNNDPDRDRDSFPPVFPLEIDDNDMVRLPDRPPFKYRPDETPWSDLFHHYMICRVPQGNASFFIPPNRFKGYQVHFNDSGIRDLDESRLKMGHFHKNGFGLQVSELLEESYPVDLSQMRFSRLGFPYVLVGGNIAFMLPMELLAVLRPSSYLRLQTNPTQASVIFPQRFSGPNEPPSFMDHANVWHPLPAPGRIVRVDNIGFGWRKENDVLSPMIMLKPNWPYQTVSLIPQLAEAEFLENPPAPHTIQMPAARQNQDNLEHFRLANGFLVEKRGRNRYSYWGLHDPSQWELTQNSLDIYQYSSDLQMWVCQGMMTKQASLERKTYGKKIPTTGFYCSQNPDPSIQDPWRTDGTDTWYDKTLSSGEPLRRTGNRWDCYKQGFGIYQKKKKPKSLTSRQKRLLQYYENHPEVDIPVSAR
jgi:hypothetical protein